jgi:hypothetical protein
MRKLKREHEVGFMTTQHLDLYTAKAKMRVKHSNYCMSFITTIWRGQVVMCTFNNIQKNIMSVFGSHTFSPDEINVLENLIAEIIFNCDSNFLDSRS